MMARVETTFWFTAPGVGVAPVQLVAVLPMTKALERWSECPVPSGEVGQGARSRYSTLSTLAKRGVDPTVMGLENSTDMVELLSLSE